MDEHYRFSSVSYFCRAFKAEVGKTPLGYRKAGN
ncbi:MAG: helix-turn-helix transcriptional regulator [Clostridia bacterium]|nr:helix-turn-helix transcriptional regulator [Clostridia bacterium]